MTLKKARVVRAKLIRAMTGAPLVECIIFAKKESKLNQEELTDFVMGIENKMKSFKIFEVPYSVFYQFSIAGITGPLGEYMSGSLPPIKKKRVVA